MTHLFKSRWIWSLAIFALTAASYAQFSDPADDIPAYHPSAPLSIHALPAILHGADLTGTNFQYHWQVRAYQLAAQVPGVIYQLPCNCRCDRALGHTSLHSCYENLHAAECSTCAKEGFYAYYKTRAGWTPAQIRAGIARHDYESIDLEQGVSSTSSNLPVDPKPVRENHGSKPGGHLRYLRAWFAIDLEPGHFADRREFWHKLLY